MTNKELRELVAKSNNYDQFKGLTVSIPYKYHDDTIKREGISSIYEYVKSEMHDWKKIKSELPKVLNDSKAKIKSLISQIENFVEKNTSTKENDFKRNWDVVKRQLMNLQGSYFSPKYPQTEFIIKVHENYPNSVEGVLGYFNLDDNKRPSLSNQNKDYWIGFHLAYEFDLQDQTEIIYRRDKEKISLGKIRSNYQKLLDEAESHFQEIIQKSSSEFDAYRGKIDELKNEKEKAFNDWLTDTKEQFSTFDTESNKKISALEETYTEKLRLEAPAQYWDTRAKNLKTNGYWWTGAFSFTLLLIVGSLYFLLWLTPDGMFADLFSGEPYAIKWAVIYVTFLSFFAYGLRMFAKLALSSFHLSKDAEERQQLTYVYLALNKETEVEEKARILILQSLFSRAETGLLKDDASPTLPGASIVERINGSG
jgi:ElaB/YqjD/DUF883 family membrane-anchored ribosome-binding protein